MKISNVALSVTKHGIYIQYLPPSIIIVYFYNYYYTGKVKLLIRGNGGHYAQKR